jgi:hypothetical protein
MSESTDQPRKRKGPLMDNASFKLSGGEVSHSIICSQRYTKCIYNLPF